MVCDDFVNQNVLGIPDEHFLKYFNTAEMAGEILEKVLADGRDESGNFAVKIMANYVGRVSHMLPGDHGLEGPYANFYAAFKGAKWVFVTRTEKDRQAISRIKAKASGIYHLRRRKNQLRLGNTVSDDKLALEKSTLQYSAEIGDEIKSEVRKIREEEAIWKKYFDFWGIEPFKITYEQAAKGGKNYLTDLAASAGLKSSENLPLRSIKKLSNSNSDVLVQQFRADHGYEYMAD